MVLNKCDRCGKIADQEQEFGDGWVVVNYNVRYGGTIIYHLCPECAEALSIPKDSQDQRYDIGERLIEILEEIAQAQTQHEDA